MVKLTGNIINRKKECRMVTHEYIVEFQVVIDKKNFGWSRI